MDVGQQCCCVEERAADGDHRRGRRRCCPRHEQSATLPLRIVDGQHRHTPGDGRCGQPGYGAVGQLLTAVAAGRSDVHWQFENLRSHVVPLLVVQESGGVVTDLDGRPWTITSPDYLAAAPGVHAEALAVLRSVRARG